MARMSFDRPAGFTPKTTKPAAKKKAPAKKKAAPKPKPAAPKDE